MARQVSTFATEPEIQIDEGVTLEIAELHAITAKIAGRMKGHLTVQGDLIVRSTGHVEGVAACRRLLVEDGGLIKGGIEMLTESPRS